MTDSIKLILSGLNNDDRKTIENSEGKAAVTFEEKKLSSTKFGEPATITAAIVLSSMGISALIAYILKDRDSVDFDREVEIVKKNGDHMKIRVRLRVRRESTKEEVAKEIAKQLNLEPSELLLPLK